MSALHHHDLTTEERKTREILESVKATFATKGFEGASMQDLARGAGMSAGNFYRYFASKDAIIEAIIEREIDCVCGEFERVMNAPRPLEAFREMVRWRIENDDQCDGPLWAEIEAAAIRRPVVAELLARMHGRLTVHLVEVFARISATSKEEAEARFNAHARMIIHLVQGLRMRVGTPPGGTPPAPDRALANLVGRAIEWVTTEIAAGTGATEAALSDEVSAGARGAAPSPGAGQSPSSDAPTSVASADAPTSAASADAQESVAEPAEHAEP